MLIEINNSSLPESGSRAGSLETCKKVARLCREYGVSITIGSDAHSCFQIGKFEHAHKLLMEVEMPEELIMNTKSGKILRYLKNKGKLEDLQLD